ncbi:MAG: hypothetical protein NTW86_31535 [Candidatus Sumerlaeota bacterium]|nr:hypothetical protein [Candidatus Sumerlaeota bacterium]
MFCRKDVAFVLSVFAAVSLVIPPNAHAYLDLGTGSYILQLAAAAVLGALFALKLFWANVKSFVKVRILGWFKRDSR